MTFKEIINTKDIVLVDFFAEWCGPCKSMPAILKQVKEKVGDNATILKIDVDKNTAAAQTYQVQSVPTLIIFKKGQIVWRQSGVLPAGALVEKVNSFSK